MSQEKLTYNAKEAAAAIGVSLSVVRQLCRRPDFPAVRISPRRIVIPADRLRRWLDDNAGKPI